MAATTLTLTIAGSTYPILNDGSFKLSSKIDETSELDVTVIDVNSVYSFQKGQQVTLTDTLQGTIFKGYVSTSEITKAPGTSSVRFHQLVCIDNHFIAMKRTTNKTYTNQYAGVVVAGMVNDVLALEGVTANYAIREDNTQAEFGQGTLSGTMATPNLGGDLELALAGSPVQIVENFSSGTLTNCQVSGSSLIPTPTPAIKLVGSETLTNDGAAYTYVKVYTSGSITIISGRYLIYDICIDPSSPSGQSGVDIVFTDGTTLRDTTQDYRYYDAQNIPPHPNHDLSGFANGRWYHRSFLLDNFAGKTISYVSVVLEGDKTGTYTTYIKNIYEVDASNNVINTFFNGTFNVNPPQQMQNSGYSNVSCTVVNTYDCITQSSQRVSPAYQIGNAGIVKNSFLSWIATQQENTNVQIEYSLNGGNSYIACTNNAALPSLLAGLSVGGTSIQFRQSFQQLPGASPESQPMLSSLQAFINPSYIATKSDVTLSATTTAQWNAGTLSNTQANNGILSLLGLVRNFNYNNTDLSGFTIFGDGAAGPGPTTINMHCNYGTMWVQTGINMEGHARYDSVGSWQNFRAECDVYIDGTQWRPSIMYRGTQDSHYDANYAYAVEFNMNTIALQKGSNSSAASTGTRTQVASASISISTASWHHVTLIINGSNHQILVDDVSYINTTDSTYSASGKISFRASNASTTAGYQGQFNNFGITVIGMSGTWVSPSTSLTAAGTYGGSVVTWEDVSIGSQSTKILVESTTNGGSSWQTVTNGGQIPSLTLGQSLSGVNLQLRATLSTQTATCMPQIQYLVARVMGGYSSSGTRIAPALSLAPALIAGSAVVNWSSIIPTNTSVAVATSPDGSSWTSVNNGGSIAGITTQPLATLDTFASNTSANYTNTNRSGGATGTWTWDTANSRITVSGGSNALLLYSPVWFNTSYLNKKQIIINHAKVVGSADLSSFPVPISMIDPDLRTVANGGSVRNNSGFDIIFVNSAETAKLDHEIEQYISTTGEIEMWVRIPTLSHTADTVIYIYYNNASISTTQENVTGVWDSNHKAVWHMDAATGSNQSDSTSNALTATQHNSPIQSAGGALTFDGLSQYFSVSGAAANITGDKTIEVLINAESLLIDANGADPRVLINNIDGTNAYQIALDGAGGGTIGFAVNDSTGQHIIANQPNNISTWYYIAGTYVASTHTVILYINGVSVANNGSLSLALGSTGFNISRRTDATGYFLGSQDEMRISNAARSAGWIGTVANSLLSPSTFFSAGPIQNQSTFSSKDIDIIVDMDQADQAGLVWRQQDASNFYEIELFDGSSSAGSTNVLKLFKVVSNVKTQLGSSTAISFTRGTPYRARVTMIGNAITVYFDGNSVLSTTDSSITVAGKAGLINVTGSAHFYNFGVQAQGQSLSGVNAYTRVTLTSTDPTVTPQMTDLVLAALHPNIALGSLIPTASYLYTYISANMDDLSKKSNTYWKIDNNLNMIFALYQSVPAPWVLTDKDILVDGLRLKNSGDLYRNRQTITGVIAIGTNSEYKTGDGTNTSWTLGGILVAAPTIYLNGQLQTVGIKGIDSGKNFYWTLDSAVIDQDSSGTILQKTDQLYFPNYTYQFSTSITVDNTGQFPNTVSQAQFAAISGGTGIVEEVEDVSSQALDVPSAIAMANGLLQRNGVIGNEMQFNTLRSGLAPGQYLPVFNPETSLNDASMLVTEVNMTQKTTLDIASGNPTQLYRYAVTLESAANTGSWSKLLASAFN